MSDQRDPKHVAQRRSWARRHWGVVGVSACLALALAGVIGVTGVTRASGKAMAGAGGKAHASGVFFVHCPYSHSANDDPILMPGQPGASMLHDFFGNTTTNAYSTAHTLRDGPTTCGTSADSSAYWTPALYANNHRVMPKRMNTYWLGASRTGRTAPLPAGLQMIAGNEQATKRQPKSVVSWDCHSPTGPKGKRNHGPKTSAPHHCPAGQLMRLSITFPNCWNGNLSAAGQQNVVYPTGSRCPSSHPVALTKLRVHVFYPNQPEDSTYTLSMGPGMRGSIYSEHADFLDGWNTSVIDRLITTCLDTHFKCGVVKGPNGTPHHQPPTTGT